MVRRAMIGAALLLLAGGAALPAQAQNARYVRELERLQALCNQNYRPACIRFGYLLGVNRGRQQEWRRDHPNWWWWQPWVR
jgi:hypothetical protein